MKATLLILLTSAVALAELQVSGFASAGFQTTSVTAAVADAEAAQQNNLSGFMLGDGALYLAHDSGKTSMMIDVPFSIMTDTASGADTSIYLGRTKAQAYFATKASDKLTLTMGQFDTPFGYEANDSKDRFFVSTSNSYSIMPVVHVGLWANYMINSSTNLHILHANNADQQSLDPDWNTGGDDANDQAMATSLAVTWSNSKMNAKVGYHMAPMSDDAGEASNYTLVHLVLGGNFGKLDAALQYDMGTNPAVADPASGSGSVMALHLKYGLNDMLGLGFRYDTWSGNEGAFGGLGYSGNNMALGANYQDSDNFEYRFEYYTNSSKAAENDDESTVTNGLHLTALYTF